MDAGIEVLTGEEATKATVQRTNALKLGTTAKAVIVIDEEDIWFFHGNRSSDGGLTEYTFYCTGIFTVKIVPFPGSLCTSICPW